MFIIIDSVEVHTEKAVWIIPFDVGIVSIGLETLVRFLVDRDRSLTI